MAIQNNCFTCQSPSLLVLAAFYASTGFLKNSKSYNQIETARFCSLARKALLEILDEEFRAATELKKNQRLRCQIVEKLDADGTKSTMGSTEQLNEMASKVCDSYSR